MNLDHRIITTTLKADAEGKNLDQYLAGRFSYHSLEKWREIIDDGQIAVNDRHCPFNSILHEGDIIVYTPQGLEEPPVSFDYSIVYEDDFLFVINKNGNLPCHPAGPFFKHTLWHHVSSRYGKIYLINRLDRETSGLLIAAKSSEVAGKFAKQLDQIEKEYRVLVYGDFIGEVDAKGWLIKDSSSIVRKKRHFVFADQLPTDAIKPQEVRTILEGLNFDGHYSLVKAVLKSGRLHQIRATMFSLGFPVVGDKLYGPDDRIYLKIRDNKITDADRQKLVMPRQALHSYRLAFVHPVTNKPMSFVAEVPEDFV